MGVEMRHWIIIALVAIIGPVVGGPVTSSLADEMTPVELGIGELRGEVLSLFAPRGAIATETNPNYKGAAAPARAAPASPAAADWPSYNKTLTSERFSDLSQINTQNVGKLKVLCTYDARRQIRRQSPAVENRRDRGPLARREAGFRGAARLAGRGEPAKPLRDHTAAAVWEPDRLGQSLGGRGGPGEHPARELATGLAGVLRLPDHGRHGSL